jgi:ribosomal protein L11 methyltransferase
MDQTDTVVARITTDAGGARQLADTLSELYDPGEVVVAAFEGADGWFVELNFEHAPDAEALRTLIAEHAGPAVAASLVIETVAARDWIALSLAGLKPVPAGRFIVHGAHDRAAIPLNRIGIEIEAALAFGTGHHGTTRGCLQALDAMLRRRRPRHMLDVGTGTGVLAIALAKALRRRVRGSDIDPLAVRVARDNARLNSAGPLLDLVVAAGLGARTVSGHGRYDLIVANILLPPLKRMATPMARLLAPHGRVMLSGLLANQENAARASYAAQGLVLETRVLLDGWVTLVLRRTSDKLRPRIIERF